MSSGAAGGGGAPAVSPETQFQNALVGEPDDQTIERHRPEETVLYRTSPGGDGSHGSG